LTAPATKAAPSSKPIWARDSSTQAFIEVPQPEQNFAPATHGWPQPEQNFGPGGASGAPHSLQNFPGDTVWPHLPQVTPEDAARRLGRRRRRGGGARRPRLHRLAELVGHRHAHAQAGAGEHRIRAAPAASPLAHGVAGAHHGVGRRHLLVALDAAGHVHVGRGLVELVQPLLVVVLHRQVEVADAHHLDAVGVGVLPHPGDDLLADLLGVGARGHVEERPLLLHAELGDVVLDGLQHQLLEPAEELLVGGALQADQADDQPRGVDDLEREAAVHHELDRQARLRIAQLADLAAELHPDDLARGDEVGLGDPDVAPGRPVDELAEEGDVRRLAGVAARRQRADQLAVAEEQRQLVGLDGELRLHRDGGVGVLVDDQPLELVGPGDGHLPCTVADEADETHLSNLRPRRRLVHVAAGYTPAP
jgi:hypothetical protein